MQNQERKEIFRWRRLLFQGFKLQQKLSGLTAKSKRVISAMSKIFRYWRYYQLIMWTIVGTTGIVQKTGPSLFNSRLSTFLYIDSDAEFHVLYRKK